MSLDKYSELGRGLKTATVLATVISVMPVQVFSQNVLEEIVVSAQRRVQSLQDVPISIEAVSGDAILQQGFRSMEDLAFFSPSVNMDIESRDSDITVRGAGSVGNNNALQQSVPTFIDGIVFGRSAQAIGRFLDIERVEILTGPQPLYFGQDALAGAFNITTRKPTPEWEGYTVAEVGSFGTKQVEFGIGGPLTDTFGIRVAGKYHYTHGHLRDIVTNEKFPRTESYVGRVTLQWTPNESFQATLQANYGHQENGGQSVVIAEADGGPILTGRAASDGQFYYITGFDGVTQEPLRPGLNRWGISVGPQYLVPGPEVRAVSNGRVKFDMTPLAQSTNPYYRPNLDWVGQDVMDPYGGYLDLKYRLANGIELTSLTGASWMRRDQIWQPGAVPFFSSPFLRGEDLTQLSQEFRATSEPGGVDFGGMSVEWMLGAYWQKQDLNLYSDAWRAQSRRQLRGPVGTDDASWKALFGTVTLNVTDSLSIDAGARYSIVKKFGRNIMYIANFIFDDGSPDGLILPHNNSAHMPPEFNDLEVIGVTPYRRGCGTGGPTSSCGLDGTNIGSRTHKEIDPQITLRYRFNDNVSSYAKWTQAFKAGSFDVEFADIVRDNADFYLEPENVESWEVGLKGLYLDGRLRANMTLFWTDFSNLQVATTGDQAIDPTSIISSRTINVGGQRVRGVELGGEALVSDRLRLGFGAALFDGYYTNFPGAGCTEAEIVAGTCDDPVRALTDRTGQKAARTPDWVLTTKANYWMPVMDTHRLTYDVNFLWSDGYITNAESFDKTISMDTHVKLNASIGIGNIDDTWRLSIYGRNLTDSRVTYHPEYDIVPTGLVTSDISPSNYRTYGVQFSYDY